MIQKQSNLVRLPGFNAEVSLYKNIDIYNMQVRQNSFERNELSPAFNGLRRCGPCVNGRRRCQLFGFTFYIPCPIQYPTPWVCDETGRCCRNISPELTQCRQA